MRSFMAAHLTPSVHAVFRSRTDRLALVPGALVVWAVAVTVLPPRTGLPAMAMVLEPLLFLAAIAVLAPIALWRRARTLAAALLVCVVAGGCLFGSERRCRCSIAPKHLLGRLRLQKPHGEFGDERPQRQPGRRAGRDNCQRSTPRSHGSPLREPKLDEALEQSIADQIPAAICLDHAAYLAASPQPAECLPSRAGTNGVRTQLPLDLVGGVRFTRAREERKHALLDDAHARPSRGEDLLADRREGVVKGYRERAPGQMA